MKRFFPVFLLFMPFFLVACGGEKYGSAIDRSALQVKVQDVFFQPELIGKNVMVEGKIYTQCQSNGCWFVLQDDTGQLYVDLSRHNFSLPARSGRTVKASGTVATQGSNFFLIAQGVEVQ